ncbi:MAG: hypothetical protein ACYDHN_13235 [Solirubrobacteraceae bacterium]
MIRIATRRTRSERGLVELRSGLLDVMRPLARWSADPEVGRRYDDVVADVFELADAAHAQGFFEDAASVRCRRQARAPVSSSPPGSRDLIWLNPDNATQYDVFLRRGALVYRIAEVRIRALAPKLEERVMLARVNRLACGLPHAGCSNQGGSSS